MGDVMETLKETLINIHKCYSLIATPHTHQFLELAYVIRGSAVHKINGMNPVYIAEGDYFIIDYGTQHEYQSEGDDLCVINCLFLPELLDKSLVYCRDFQTLLQHYLIKINSDIMNFSPSNHIFHDEDKKILNILNEMLEEYDAKQSSWTELVRSDLIKLFIYTARKIPSNGRNLTLTQTIINEVGKSFAGNVTLSDITCGMNYSLPYISKKFYEDTGMSFREYLKKTRINEACRLLANSDKKIEEISVLSGYGDTDCFRKAFREITGTTPNKFRHALTKGL